MRWRVTPGLVLALLGLPAAQAATVTATSLQRPEGARHYLRATPAPQRTGRLPLVIILHGHGGSAAQVLGQQHTPSPLSVWLQIADREGVLLVAPDGQRGGDGQQGWNDCRKDTTDNPSTDDVGLLRAIIDREVASGAADPERVYVTGMSNGGMMTFRAAIELGDRLAGFAAFSGSMAAVSACAEPRWPLSGLIVSGTADPLVPYLGGAVGFKKRSPRGSVIGVEEALARWRKVDGLAGSGEQLPAVVHREAQDATRITRTRWGAQPQGLQLELVRVEQGGHVEPSPTQHYGWLYLQVVGPQNRDLESAEESWAFLREKRLMR